MGKVFIFINKVSFIHLFFFYLFSDTHKATEDVTEGSEKVQCTSHKAFDADIS